MNKKGFFMDYLMWMVFILIFAIVVIIAYMTLSKSNDGFQSDSNIPTASKTILGNWTSRFKSVFDWFMVTVLLGVSIGLIISAWIMRDSPAYIVIAIICLIIIGSLAYRFSNVFYQFSSSSGIQPYSSQFSLTPMMMNRLPILIIFILVLFIIVLFGKSRSDSFL